MIMDSHANTAADSTESHNKSDGAAAAGALPELTLGEGGPAEAAAAEPQAAPTIRGRIDKFGTAMGTGRRKTSVARVRIVRGNGKLTINKRTLEDYFRVERNRALVEGPLLATDMLGKVDIWVRAQGGGTTGQVGAIVLGIARALQAMDPGLHPRLSEGNFLTRDGRMVERKKYGRKKARRSFQFSKR
jgi:small subunit ribosomal protein S9